MLQYQKRIDMPQNHDQYGDQFHIVSFTHIPEPIIKQMMNEQKPQSVNSLSKSEGERHVEDRTIISCNRDLSIDRLNKRQVSTEIDISSRNLSTLDGSFFFFFENDPFSPIQMTGTKFETLHQEQRERLQNKYHDPSRIHDTSDHVTPISDNQLDLPIKDDANDSCKDCMEFLGHDVISSPDRVCRIYIIL